MRSSNDDIRLKALSLAGVPEKLRNDAVRPAQIELRYAALGTDATQQAILAVQVGQYGFATVATPKGNAWERVAQFNCWCKYDMSHFLDEFVQIARAPDLNVERALSWYYAPVEADRDCTTKTKSTSAFTWGR